MTASTNAEYPAHDHVFLGAAHDRNAQRTLWVVGLTAVMMVAEIIAGYVTGSMALLADGFHMATHAGALGLAAAAYSYAKKHRNNPKFSFGTGKVGDLTGFASALILGIFALGIASESVTRLIDPVRVDFGNAALVAVLGLLVNIVSALLLIVADSMELWAQQDPSRRFWRIFFSVLGYIMRPTAALSICLIVYPKTKRPFWLWIPNIINACIYCTAFFSDLAFYFGDDYHFGRGPLSYSAHVVSFLYIAMAVVMTWISFRRKDHTRERFILYICAVACIVTAWID
ncbi:cation diffusion facilitator family transporter, partial [Bosea sp. (in: a-proteobacteria)]|uniref:cation diffusion facilitator family transporter n=1 Tax=Bosea sp. (in: a-proteobacteria) TaxID=1871050 RepID=UPI0025BC9035